MLFSPQKPGILHCYNARACLSTVPRRRTQNNSAEDPKIRKQPWGEYACLPVGVLMYDFGMFSPD